MPKSFIMIIVSIVAVLFVVTTYGDLAQKAIVKQNNTTGEALIGGAFSLTNHEGKAVTDQNFQGKLMLVFFGFTNCPDVCPTDLQVMSNAMDILGEDANQVVPIFITVDHENDTVEKMADYVSNFHPTLQGLTGTEEQLKSVQQAYRVYAQKMEGNFTMTMYNHSAMTYLMNREGNYIAHFSHDSKPAEMAQKIKKFL